jgi:hypothetical protein
MQLVNFLQREIPYVREILAAKAERDRRKQKKTL